MIYGAIRGPGIAVRQNGLFLRSALREGSLLPSYAEASSKLARPNYAISKSLLRPTLQPDAIDGRLLVCLPWRPEAVWSPGQSFYGARALDARCREYRILWRSADCPGGLYRHRRVARQRRDGHRLFPATLPAQFLAHPQPRRNGRAVCFVFLYIASQGDGRWSARRLLKGKRF